MSNGSLHSFIKSNKNDELFSLMTIYRMIQGIEYLQRNNLIHRDLKPQNILIDHDYIPYISDFDTIRHLIEEKDFLNNEEMTQDLGSQLYISPEQYNGDFTSFPTDIYSFGLILYFIKERKDMRSGSDKIKEIKKMTKGSKNLKELFISCVENSPDERPKIDEIKSKIIDEINSFYNYERILLSDDKMMNKFKNINFIIESAIIQIGNTKTIKKFIQNISTFLSLYYKDKSDILFGLGKYHYDNKNYYKANEFFKQSSLLNNSDALRCLLEPFVNNSTNIPKDLNIFFLNYQKNIGQC